MEDERAGILIQI